MQNEMNASLYTTCWWYLCHMIWDCCTSTYKTGFCPGFDRMSKPKRSFLFWKKGDNCPVWSYCYNYMQVFWRNERSCALVTQGGGRLVDGKCCARILWTVELLHWAGLNQSKEGGFWEAPFVSCIFWQWTATSVHDRDFKNWASHRGTQEWACQWSLDHQYRGSHQWKWLQEQSKTEWNAEWL